MPSKKYPLLVFIHGGPASNNPDQVGLRWNYHLLAAPGYVILMTDYTGSTGFGEKFAQAIKLDPLKTPGDEINQAVDEALKRYSIHRRLENVRHGRQLRRPSRQLDGGHHHPIQMHRQPRRRGRPHHPMGHQRLHLRARSDQWRAALGRQSIWHDQSPITYAAQWKTPMLLSIGERDYRVPLGNTLENWSTLQRMHVPSRLLVWPDAWHWIPSPKTAAISMRRCTIGWPLI